EGAHVESAFFAGKAINPRFGWVAVHKTIADQTAMAWTLEDRIKCTEHPWIVWSHEEYQRHDQERGIQILTSVRLSESLPLLAPSVVHNFFIYAIPFVHPSLTIRWQGALISEPATAIQSNPVHDLRIHKMSFPIAHLPDAGIRTLPVITDPVEAPSDSDPRVVRDRADILFLPVHRIH